MAERGQLARPVVRRGIRLDPYQARLQAGKKAHHRAPAQGPAHHWLARVIDAVDLKYVLRNIETNGANLYGGRLLSLVAFYNDPVMAHRCRKEGPSTPSSRTLEPAPDLIGGEPENLRFSGGEPYDPGSISPQSRCWAMDPRSLTFLSKSKIWRKVASGMTTL